MSVIKILLVDDEEGWRNILQDRTKQVLIALGYSEDELQIVCAEKFPEAMTIMDAQAPWNLLIIDIRILPWFDEHLGMVLVRRAKYMRWATIAVTAEPGQVTPEEEKYFKDNKIYFFDKDFLNKSQEYAAEIKKIVGKSKSKIEVFLSYKKEDTKDEVLLQTLDRHLGTLKQDKVISTWSSGEIGAGQEWKEEIKKHLNSADIILLLVSASFMSSDFCWEELGQAIARHNAGDARVIPIILRPCDWETSKLGKLKPLPKDGKPVTTWQNQEGGLDGAFTDVAKGIRKVVEELRAKRQLSP